MRTLQLQAAAGEIGLKAGAESPYIRVINIGDVAGLMKLLQKQGIACDRENSTVDAVKYFRAIMTYTPLCFPAESGSEKSFLDAAGPENSLKNKNILQE